MEIESFAKCQRKTSCDMLDYACLYKSIAANDPKLCEKNGFLQRRLQLALNWSSCVEKKSCNFLLGNQAIAANVLTFFSNNVDVSSSSRAVELRQKSNLLLSNLVNCMFKQIAQDVRCHDGFSRKKNLILQVMIAGGYIKSKHECQWIAILL